MMTRSERRTELVRGWRLEAAEAVAVLWATLDAGGNLADAWAEAWGHLTHGEGSALLEFHAQEDRLKIDGVAR